MSGVTVAHIIKSISSAEVLVLSKRPFIASAPKSEDPFFPFKILLSFIPVLVTIHSSFVSTNSSNSLLSKI